MCSRIASAERYAARAPARSPCVAELLVGEPEVALPRRVGLIANGQPLRDREGIARCGECAGGIALRAKHVAQLAIAGDERALRLERCGIGGRLRAPDRDRLAMELDRAGQVPCASTTTARVESATARCRSCLAVTGPGRW